MSSSSQTGKVKVCVIVMISSPKLLMGKYLFLRLFCPSFSVTCRFVVLSVLCFLTEDYGNSCQLKLFFFVGN